MNARRDSRRRSVFGWPAVIGLLSAAALIVGLLGQGIYDLLCWGGLALPIAAIWRSWERRGRA